MAEIPIPGTEQTEEAAGDVIARAMGRAPALPAEEVPEAKPRDSQGKFVTAEPDPEEETEAPEVEVEEEAEEAETTTEADEEGETLPETLAGLAEAIGVDDLFALTMPTKVQGEERDISLADLRSGYQMEADYRKNNAALREKSEAFEAERQSVQAERQHFTATVTPMLQQMGEGLRAEEVRLQAMLDVNSESYNPEGYIVEKARFDNQARQFQIAAQEHNRVQQAQDADRQRMHEEDVASHERQLIEMVPSWKDPEIGKREIGEIRTYAVSQGLTQAEADSAYKAPHLIMARKAMLFDKLMEENAKLKESAKKKVKKVQKFIKPGAAKAAPSKEVASIKSARARFAKSPNVKSAAEIIRQQMGR